MILKASIDDFTEILGKLSGLASKAQMKDVERKFQKFALKDNLMEVNAKVELIKDEISNFVKIEYVNHQIESLSNDIKEAIHDHVTKQGMDQRFDIYDAKLKKLRRDIQTEMEEFIKIEDDVKFLQQKLDN